MSNNSAFSANAEFLAQAYDQWQKDPSQTPADLANFFEGFEFAQSENPLAAGGPGNPLQSSVDSLIYHYRTIGHRIAQINPLGGNQDSHPELELENFGLSEADLDETFNSNHMPLYEQATLRQMIADLRATYCGFVGVEFMHIQETAERRWLQEKMEGTRLQPNFATETHLHILWKLKKAEMFEHFLHTTYRGQKRFSLEGGETTIAALDHIIELSPGHGIEEVVFGMAHRGRLNVLANILGKGYEEIFSEFEDNYSTLPGAMAHGDGDVKYHKGYSKDVQTSTGATVHLSLTANPSHLEVVGPVVEGKVRAKQALRGDTERRKVLPFVIHGDAAFAGQGIVAETFNLSQLKGYRTGGTIHFVINNQVGFTTSAQDYLSGLYCSDMGKMMALPIFHVNGDQPEHVLMVMGLALEYRQKFQKDVVVDMWCYRRHGHNEGDEPGFTQPLLYSKIAGHTTVDDLYLADLARRGERAAEQTEQMAKQFEDRLAQAKALASKGPEAKAETASDTADHQDEILGGYWRSLKREYSHQVVETGIEREWIEKIARAYAESAPATFQQHRKIEKLNRDFLATVLAGGRLQWAQGEALAFGALLMEGRGIRLSGEDCRRGTFSQRHAVLYDQQTGERYIPLMHLKADQPQFCVYDSSLAEASVLAFDYGYAVADPTKLIMWEAQFGDFANGAQVVIDQFIAGGASKWGRMNGLVLLLPHGYEGQGPEHSNAWLSRYLGLCAEQNIEVVYPTTPAQYFHLLRRQVLRNFRRPLIVMTPKSLLRDPAATSTVEEFTQGHFEEVLDDTLVAAGTTPRRVLFCSGKVYYDLRKAAEKAGTADVALVRVEQFYPFDEQRWTEIAEKYAGVGEWVWVSEEPTNFGAWSFMKNVLAVYHEGHPIWYVGRARSASPATGSHKRHQQQQQLLVEYALAGGPLHSELENGIAVFTEGDKIWHMKSKSHRPVNRSQKAPSLNG